MAPVAAAAEELLIHNKTESALALARLIKPITIKVYWYSIPYP